MKQLSKYRLITLIVLALICQLVVSRVACATVAPAQLRANVSKLDHIVLSAAPQNALLSAEGEAPANQKINGGFAKSLTGNHNQSPMLTPKVAQSSTGCQPKSAQTVRLWLLYRTLLL